MHTTSCTPAARKAAAHAVVPGSMATAHPAAVPPHTAQPSPATPLLSLPTPDHHPVPWPPRWVPYKHSNGLAIYYHESPGEEDAMVGGEYMVSAIVRGSPQECLAILMNPLSNTTLLGPASKVEVLSMESESQVGGWLACCWLAYTCWWLVGGRCLGAIGVACMSLAGCAGTGAGVLLHAAMHLASGLLNGRGRWTYTR